MPSVREDIVKLTQEADRLTEYYVQRIKKYGVAATRTEVAKGEARIAEIGKMVRDLEAKEQANYGFKGQGWKQRMESLKSADTMRFVRIYTIPICSLKIAVSMSV